MNSILSNDREYKKWIYELKDKIGAAQIKAAVAVNRELLELYWNLGQEIFEKEQISNWGEGLIEQLARDLSAMFPGIKGFSRANLFFMRKWYLFYKGSIVSQVVRLIPWGHNRLIITKCSQISEAIFYVRATMENNWSRAVLAVQMESGLYQRSGKTINNFSAALTAPQADLARETLKNPYNFDFLTLGKNAQERDMENALTDHIQNFILELGQGFAFMGRQYPIHVGDDDFYIDLLFYHTQLRCYVIVELKTSEFKPEYIGKLNFYLNVVNAKLKHAQDQPSIGILLCKTPNKLVVEYALKNIQGPLGVAEYSITNAVPEDLKGSLPSIEELEMELEERAAAK